MRGGYQAETKGLGIIYIHRRSGLPFKHGSGGSKVHDLSPDDANTAVVTGVQLQDHRAELLGWVDLLGAGQDGAGLPCPGRAVEQEVGQLVVLDEGPDGVDDVLVGDQLIQGIGPVLLHPGQVHTGLGSFCHHQFQDILSFVEVGIRISGIRYEYHQDCLSLDIVF